MSPGWFMTLPPSLRPPWSGNNILIMKFYSITWEDFQQHIFQIAERISKDNFKPDIIIAIARGGLSVAQILSDYFDNCPILVFTISSYKNLQQSCPPKVRFCLDDKISLDDKKILLVDDLSDVGGTFVSGLNYLKTFKIKHLKTAAVVVKPHSKFLPDYHAIDKDGWIIFPYEMKETTINLVNKFKKEGLNEKEIIHKLRQLKIGKTYIKKYFDPLKK